MNYRYSVIALLGMLLGCADDNHTVDSQKSGVINAQFKSIDKAKLAEKQIMDAAKRQRRAIQEAEN